MEISGPAPAISGDVRAQVRDFLVSRRSRITPEEAGLPAYGGANRRVAGLRREEVALLAGVSIDYYVRMERGGLGGVSDPVLDGVAAALRLDEAERAHLFDLARAAGPGIARRGPARQRRGDASRTERVTDGMRQVLDAITDAPAWIRDFRYNKLAFNQLGAALYAPLLADQNRPLNHQARPFNSARFVFLDPAAREFYADWELIADDIAAVLRSEAGRHPDDRRLHELIGELSARSEQFAVRWAAHNVRFHRAGHKVLNHPAVGRLDLSFEAMEFPAHPGLTMIVYTAPAGTPTADNLRLLASWAAELPSPGAPAARP